MTIRYSCLFSLAILCLGSLTASAAEPFRFPEGRFGKGELRYINDVPVLIVAGTPGPFFGRSRMHCLVTLLRP